MLIRIHTPADYPGLAELRWLSGTADGQAVVGQDKAAFLERYHWHLSTSELDGRTVHWVVEEDGALVAVMTVRIVAREPSPGQTSDAWGYLTNVYVLAGRRNRGLGTQLLAAVRSWAAERDLELLIVWPSETSERFYRRAGFQGRAEPLVLPLADPG
ncbi:GNAT family N-acetyltransferase [Thalassobaculum sp.]|uniref:GNAT family N-acetyltransferase n=1 Tax=Thalassobaculum sp. TaxID=2022740 RepID=UPI0032F002EB